MLKVLQVLFAALDVLGLRHVQVGINLHRGSRTLVADAARKGFQIEVCVIFMIDIAVRYVCMTQAVYRYTMLQCNCLADLAVRLAQADTGAAAEGERAGAADVLVLLVVLDILFTDFLLRIRQETKAGRISESGWPRRNALSRS